jgi:thiol-disulfide isomerase/thioredoxin
MLGRGPITFVLVYADWCGHCQRYKPMWQKLARTPGRIANMAAVRDDMFPKVAKIANAKIQGYPSVIKVGRDGSIARFNVNGQETNAIDSGKMRDLDAMRKEITTPASEPASIAVTPTAAKPLDITKTIIRDKQYVSKSSPSVGNPTSKLVDAGDDGTDIYTGVSKSQPGFKRGTYESDERGSLLTDKPQLPQEGGAVGVAAAFINAVQSVGPAALLLAAHSILPKRGRTYKSPKRASHRGGTRRSRRV